MSKSIRVTLSKISGAANDYYSMVDQDGNSIFSNVYGASLSNGITYSVLPTSVRFTITNTQITTTSTFAIWNSLDANAHWILTNGDLTAEASGSGIMRATVGHTTGKYYMEYTIISGISNFASFGVATRTKPLSDNDPSACYINNGTFYWLGSSPSYATTLSAGDVLGIYTDFDGFTIKISINGTVYGDAITDFNQGLWADTYYPCVGGFSTNVKFSTNFGASSFTYPPGAGWLGWSMDIDAQSFISIIGITSSLYKSNLNTLVLDAKKNGWWSKCYVIYPFIGATESTHKYNLKNPLNTDAAFRLSFTGSWTHLPSGIKGNGTNTYTDTHLIPANVMVPDDTHASIYCSSDDNGLTLMSDFGSGDDVVAPFNSPRIATHLKFNDTLYADQYDVDNNRQSISNTDARGYYIETRPTSTLTATYRNGSDMGSPNTASSVGFSDILFSTYIGAANFNGVANNFSSRQYSFFTMGNGIDSSLATLMYNNIQNFQISIGRAVLSTNATWNPSDKNADITLSGGDLITSDNTNGGFKAIRANVSKNIYKWFWEITPTVGGSLRVGIAKSSESLSANLGSGPDAYAFIDSGSIANNGITTAYGSSWGTGDVIGIAFNATNGILEFYKNGVYQGVAFTGMSGDFFPALSTGLSTFSFTANFGKTMFTYPVPAGYNYGIG